MEPFSRLDVQQRHLQSLQSASHVTMFSGFSWSAPVRSAPLQHRHTAPCVRMHRSRYGVAIQPKRAL